MQELSPLNPQAPRHRTMTIASFFAIFVKFFFILTPFFVIAVFLAMTEYESDATRRSLALRTTLSMVVISNVMLFFGDTIFALFGITVDAFRIGAGALLFLTAVSLVEGRFQLPAAKASIMDLAIVPLAIPTALGPGAVGALLVMGSEASGWQGLTATAAAVTLASIAVGLLLLSAQFIKRVIGRSGISTLSKITGLILAALSCQMIFTGVAAFLKPAA